jgi:DNA-binding XRE family transcriptional regulator
MVTLTTRTKVRGYRVMLGKTQKEMAEIFNISKQAYSAKERGESRFSNEEMVTIKEMLLPMFPGITIDEIFFSKK